jgi:alpha-2-macroglobulin
MSKRLLLILASIVVITMVAIPFFSGKSNSAVSFTQVDPAYGAYVSAYTSGTISNESVIRVTLTEDYTGTIALDKPTDENYFSFTPAIAGKTYWLDTRTLEFRPDNRLPSDQTYEAELDLKKILADIPDQFRNMKFGFRTMKQNFNVVIDGMKTTDRKTLRKQQLMGSVITADAADQKTIEALLTASQNGQKLTITWDHDGDHVTHRFVVTDIVRAEKEGKVTVSWDGKPLSLDQKSSSDVTIPSLKDFKVMDVAVEQFEQQCIAIEFSDPIEEKQNLNGLLTLSDGVALRFTVEDNYIRAYPESELVGDYTLNISTGVKNILGYKLPNAFTQKIKFEKFNPQIKLVGQGIILPNSGNGMLFPFKAVSLKSVDVRIVRIFENNIPQFLQMNQLDGKNELYRVGQVVVRKKIDLTVKNNSEYGRWMNYSLDLSELMKAEPGAIYRVSLGFQKDYAVCDCPVDTTVKEEEEYYYGRQTLLSENEDQYDGGYGYYGDYYEDDYYWGDREGQDPCDRNYYYGRVVSRNILSSDLGLVAKKGNDGSMLFSINDLISTNPVSGASIQVFDFQHQLLGSTQTGSDGIARMDLGKKKAFLMIAQNGNQRGYLKLDDGSSISVSAFDVSGQMVQKGLKGFIYGERGVWRPGDTLFLGFILEDKQKTLPESHPVTFELVNSRGQVVDHIIRSQSVNGFYNFTTPTDADAPTGMWTARVKVGGALFTKSIRIETIMPNRLKINLNIGNETMISSSDQKLQIESRWLHGATAKNLKTKVEVSLYESETKFKGYDNYIFDDPATNFYTDNKIIYDDRLNEEGKAEFSAGLSAENAPGMLRASFYTRVFEEGGAFSSDRFSLDFSPYDNYVGILVPKGEGWGGMWQTGKDCNVRVATVDKNGKPTSRQHLVVKVYKVDWRWWWSSDYDNLSRYVSSDYYSPYFEKEITSKNGIGSFTFNVKNEDYGRYLVRVTDTESGHSTGNLAWFDWPYWDESDGDSKHNDIASLLQFKSDKPKYNVGETMTVTIPSPGQGRALISIENGSHIISANWVETKEKGDIIFTSPITSEMSPNVYVNVTLIQPHGQVKNDAPIRLYGVIPITVDDPKTHLTPQINTAAVWKPEEKAAVTVSEKDGKPMTYTLAIVDEGLLDITRFKTPDPWNSFYAREALGVKSFDMYDLVMGAYGAEMSRVLGIGGDGEEANGKGQKANRFKPMVKYMGPFELKAGENKVHTFLMPQYVGSVRVMVIAGQDNAYGNVEKTVAVRKPLMLLGTLPRVLGPGETVDLPVDVFAMEKKVKNVTVTVSTNGFFSIEDGATKTTTFKEIGDNIVNFRLKVADAVGVGTVKIVASGGGEQAEYNIELEVRSPNPPMTDSKDALIDPGQSWSSDYTPIGISGTNSGKLEISSIPPINLGTRLNYLLQYPHGCIEQTTSSVFPQLYLSSIMELSTEKKNEIDKNIKAGIDRLRKFQISSGGLGYWPGDGTPSEWGTNYAGHFLLEAEAKGYALPAGLIDNWKKFQREQATNWTPRADKNVYYNDDLTQAYRLYTLALAKVPELGAMNRLKETKSLSIAAKWRLAAAYQLAGQTDVAQNIITGLSTTIPAYTELSWSYGTAERDEAMILETMSLIGGSMRTKAAPVAKMVSDKLNANYWMSTQTTAYCLIAICKFSGNDAAAAGINCEYTVNKQSGKIDQKKPMAQIDLGIKETKAGKISVKNNGKSVLFVRVILNGQPAAGNEVAANSNLRIEVSYQTVNGVPLDPSKIEQGTDFVASVTVFNPGLRGEYREVALTQVFPSGWEIRNTRLEEAQTGLRNSWFSFQDIRDDRVNTYFWVSPYRSNTYHVQLNATYTGHYYLPATYCEAMYDHTINARNSGMWVDVVPEMIQ